MNMMIEVKRELWCVMGTELEYDYEYLNALLALVDLSLMKVGEKEQVVVLASLAKLWVPKPASGQFGYNTPQYNTQEAVCLAINRAIAII